MESPLVLNGTLMPSNYTITTPAPATKIRPTWYWVLRGLLGVITIVGNGLVIYIISSRRRLRSQPSPNWYILSLAVADFFVGAFNAPAMFFYTFYIKSDPDLWIGLQFFMNVFLIASTTNICAMTLDRYIAVIVPFKHAYFSKGSSCAFVLFIAWIIPVLQRVPYLVFKIVQPAKEHNSRYQIFYILVIILLPNLFLLFAYTRIIFVAREHRKQIRALTTQCESTSGFSMESSSATNDSEAKQKRRRLRSSYNGTIAIGVVVFIFLVCNGFLSYWLVCRYLFSGCNENEDTNSFFAMVLLRYINSAPNFFVYCLMKSDFRSELKRMVKCQ